MSGPRSRDVSAWPGAPGAGSGGDRGPAVPIKSGVVGNNDFLAGGPGSATVSAAFPGYTGDTWQDLGTGQPVNPSTMTDPGHVSGGIRVTSPEAFPGGGQHV